MTTEIAQLGTSVPAHLVGRVGVPSTIANDMGSGISSGVDYPRLSIKGSRFRIIEDGVESLLDAVTLDIVIVGANPGLSKTWYGTAWTPDSEPTTPDCFSMDGIAPSPSSTLPQNDLCASCPQNAWGSRVTQQGTKVKACADQKRLAVLAADDPSGSVYLLQVTPAAIKGMKGYWKKLQQHGIIPEIARTVVSFDTDASFPKLKFAFGGYLTPEAQKVVDERLEDAIIKEITGGGEPAPQPVPQPVVPSTPAPQPAALAVIAPQPVVTGFGAAIAANGAASPAPVAAAEPVPAPVAAAEPVPAPVAAAEPVPAPVAAPDDATKGLADEITTLMNEVADDAT